MYALRSRDQCYGHLSKFRLHQRQGPYQRIIFMRYYLRNVRTLKVISVAFLQRRIPLVLVVARPTIARRHFLKDWNN